MSHPDITDRQRVTDGETALNLGDSMRTRLPTSDVAAKAAPTQPLGGSDYTVHRTTFLDRPSNLCRDRAAGKTYCQTQGGELVKIDNQAENDAIAGTNT